MHFQHGIWENSAVALYKPMWELILLSGFAMDGGVMAIACFAHTLLCVNINMEKNLKHRKGSKIDITCHHSRKHQDGCSTAFLQG